MSRFNGLDINKLVYWYCNWGDVFERSTPIQELLSRIGYTSVRRLYE